MPSTFDARVRTANSEVEFKIKKNSTGRDLFTQICHVLGIRESWYCGVTYIDEKGRNSYVRMKKKLKPTSKNSPMEFILRIRYYPENVTEELIQEATQELFYYEVKRAIISGDVYCPAETAVLLASYQAVVRHGPYQKDIHQPGFLNVPAYVPAHILEQYQLTNEEWEAKIVNWYAQHGDMLRVDAIMSYLKIAQDLEMYGVTYYPIKNTKGTNLWLGVDALGLNIYSEDNRLVPKVSFPWSEIRKLSYNHSKFLVKPSESGAKDLVFLLESTWICKEVMDLCAGNHELYARRRRPDSVEIQQMKSQAREIKLAREKEREKLLNERRSRVELEEKMERMMRKMSEQGQAYENSRHTLTEYQGKMAELEMQLEEERRARAELQAMQRRLEEVNRQLEQESAATTEDYKRLLSERETVMSDIATRQKIINNGQLDNGESSSIQGDGDDDSEKQKESAERELSSLDGLEQPEIYRQTMAAQDADYAKQLEGLKSDLDTLRDRKRLKDIDRHYEVNLSKGMDKYRTLQAIRQGNTRKRVEQFESM